MGVLVIKLLNENQVTQEGIGIISAKSDIVRDSDACQKDTSGAWHVLKLAR